MPGSIYEKQDVIMILKNTCSKVIVGIGSALVDILTDADDAFLDSCGAVKGGMTLVDDRFIQKTLSQLPGEPTIVPGGSACNTIIGIANLEGSARFVGKLGLDGYARLFSSCLMNDGVNAVLFQSSLPTGRVLSLITPDAQRSMFTYLGASSETQPEEISQACFDQAAIVHLEGYLAFNQDLLLCALQAAKKSGALVSLDLASFTVVEAAKVFLDSVIQDYVDVLIANEDESRAFTGFCDEIKALRALSQKVQIAVVKVGKRGSYIAHADQIIAIPPAGDGTAVDTTGAGDLWASGFLYGLVNGFPLDQCGKLASLCGYEVCQVVGAQIPKEGWLRIKQQIKDNNWRKYA